MKKVLLALLFFCVVIFPRAGFCDPKSYVLTNGVANGYFWLELPDDISRAAIIIGYIRGFSDGFISSFSISKQSQEYLSQKFGQEHDGMFYYKEFEAFLQQYPLCKKQDLNNLLFTLSAGVWFADDLRKFYPQHFENIKKYTYEDAARGCLKLSDTADRPKE
jgi:hypothetical protein